MICRFIHILDMVGLTIIMAVFTACNKGSSQQQSNTQRGKLTSEQVYKKCNPSVFTIVASMGGAYSQGSGFFISTSGVAVSNYHVFDGTIRGSEHVYLSNKDILPVSEILDYDADLDIIIFRVALEDKKIRALKMTDRNLVIGQNVYAIGSPLNMTNTFSSGEISQFRGENKSTVQINVPIDHGSSGGPLINEYGEVIGITSSKIENTSANLNFAINIQLVKNMLPKKELKKATKKKYKIKKKYHKK